MKVLHVIGDLDYHGTGRQLRLVARRLADLGIESLVIVLKGPTPWSRELCTLGIDVQTLGWSRPFDLAPWWRLWKWYRRFQPDVVHAWGLTALRVCSCLTLLPRARSSTLPVSPLNLPSPPEAGGEGTEGPKPLAGGGIGAPKRWTGSAGTEASKPVAGNRARHLVASHIVPRAHSQDPAGWLERRHLSR